jgi:heme-binding NEAT domain protein
MTYSPIGMLSRAVSNVVGNISRGVTGPSDDTQETSSVQSSTQSPSDGGGITTISNYAPLINVSTGDNTTDAMRARLENLLKVPTTQTVFQNQNVNPLINYTLSDLYNLRR